MLDNITIGNLRTYTKHPHPQVRGLMGITKNLTSVPKSISLILYKSGCVSIFTIENKSNTPSPVFWI